MEIKQGKLAYSYARYQLTERTIFRLNDYVPSNDDPLAQAMKRHSGVYDLRDTQSGNVIVGSSNNLKYMRDWQAKLNTADMLD